MSDPVLFTGCLLCGLALAGGLLLAIKNLRGSWLSFYSLAAPRSQKWSWGWLRLFRPLNRGKFLGPIKIRLQKRLNDAGVGLDLLEAPEIITLKEISGAAFLLIPWLLGPPPWWFLAGLGAGGFFLPDLVLRDRVNLRRRRLVQELPPFLDLLTLTMEAGLDFILALELVTDRGPQNTVNHEFKKILQKIRLGWSRGDALRRLADSLELPAFRNLTAAVLQAESAGASLSPVLRIQSDLLKRERAQRAEKLAHQAPVKMLAPLMIFIFPVIFIILFGPMLLEYLGK
jgi:tight adherence protein C